MYYAVYFSVKRVQRKRSSGSRLAAVDSALLGQKNSSNGICAHVEEKKLGQCCLVRSLVVLIGDIYISQARSRAPYEYGLDTFRFIEYLSMSIRFSDLSIRDVY